MQKKQRKKPINQNDLLHKGKGITLIALVITIIVLLILAGVTISALSGDNGIITRAGQAREKTEKAEEKEGLEIAVTSSQMEDVNELEINKENLEKAIKQQFGTNKDFSVTDNGDGSFLVNMNDTKRIYYVDESGKVISEENMLKISTADELEVFRDDVNSGNTYKGWYVYLANDITLDINEEWEPIGLYPAENSSPNDKTNKPFSGIFDGCGYEANGIYINTTNKVQGLFGLVKNGKISNLGTGENCNITGGISTAGLVGYLYTGKIFNCWNKSNINGTDLTGGIAGQTYNSLIENSYNLGKINGSGTSIAGITGALYNNSSMKKCYNNGEIIGIKHIGGIAGVVHTETNLEECYNVGNIEGDYAGGLVGQIYNASLMQNCYNTGNVIGNQFLGGIAGKNMAKIYNCYNIGNIEGTSRVGGIVGENSILPTSNTIAIIKNTYSLENTCENIYGNNDSDAIVEESSIKTEEEMKLLATVLGEYFKNDYTDDGMINNGYPILTWQ